MLRAIVKHARLIDDIGQKLGMPWRKAIMPAWLDVQELVEGIAVGQPGGALLVGAEEVAMAIEGQADRKTDAGAHRLALSKIRRKFLDGAAVAVNIEKRFAVLGFEIRIGIVRGAQAEIQIACLVHGHAERVHGLWDFLPALSDDNFLVGLIIAVGINDQRHLAFIGDKQSLSFLVTFRRQENAAGAAHAGLVFPEELDFILQAVAVGIGKEVDVAVVTKGYQLAVVAIANA